MTLRLVERLLRGEAAAYVDAMNRYGRLVLSVVAPMLEDERDVEEVVQDVFVKAFSNIRRFRHGEASFATWLARIARHAAIDRLRRYRPAMTDLPHSLEIEDVSVPADTELLEAAINRLRGEERVLLNLVYFEEMKPAEAAAVMEITPAVLSSRLYRIKLKLAKIIDEIR